MDRFEYLTRRWEALGDNGFAAAGDKLDAAETVAPQQVLLMAFTAVAEASVTHPDGTTD